MKDGIIYKCNHCKTKSTVSQMIKHHDHLYCPGCKVKVKVLKVRQFEGKF